jgi:pentatricopeptide repeat protein
MLTTWNNFCHPESATQNVKPDRVIFNTLITACGRAGALVRAFEVLGDMRDELDPVAPDHFTYGSLIAACARAGEVCNLRRSSNILLFVLKLEGSPN